jgi:DNA-binding transcriptional MerR regulator
MSSPPEIVGVSDPVTYTAVLSVEETVLLVAALLAAAGADAAAGPNGERWAATGRRSWRCAGSATAPGWRSWPPTTGSAPRRPTATCTRRSTPSPIGLLSPAERAGQRRRYPPSSAERVALIRLCQDAGLALAEIGRLLAGMGRGRQDWRRLAERKIGELDARIADAQRAKELITHALECPHRDLQPSSIPRR